jgi:hypothetical protein
MPAPSSETALTVQFLNRDLIVGVNADLGRDA